MYVNPKEKNNNKIKKENNENEINVMKNNNTIL